MLPPESTLLTTLLALSAAAQFAAGTLVAKRGLEHMDSVTGATVQIATSTLLFAAAAPFTIEAHFWLSPAVWVFAAIGLLRPSVSTILANEGNRRIGPTISSTLESMSPLFAVAGGIAFLGEQLTVLRLVGTLGVVAGVIIMSSKGRLPRNWPLWALLFPLTASLIRSSAHVGAKWGLLMLPSVVMSGLIAYGVSALVALAAQQVRSGAMRRVGLRTADAHPVQGSAPRAPLSRAGWGWFVAAGVFNAGAIFSLNSALMIGQVVLVSPVVAAYPVFTLLGSRLFYRQEQITARTVLGIAFIVPSIVIVTLGR